MKTLMLDMDDVLVDGILLDFINQFAKKSWKKEELKNYFLQELIKDQEEEFWEWMKDKNMYENATLTKGCFEVLNRLKNSFDIYIVTAYLWKDTIDISGDSLKNKYNYLRENLPFIPPEKYIFTTNKNILNFDIKVDDRLTNLAGASTKILFSAWHNRDLDKSYLKENNIIRVEDWYELERILLKELES